MENFSTYLNFLIPYFQQLTKYFGQLYSNPTIYPLIFCASTRYPHHLLFSTITRSFLPCFYHATCFCLLISSPFFLCHLFLFQPGALATSSVSRSPPHYNPAHPFIIFSIFDWISGKETLNLQYRT